LIDYLKYTTPGFVYSVGLSPVLAAASMAALEVMRDEPERVQDLQNIQTEFLQKARDAGLDTGRAESGTCIVPVMTGSSIKAVQASEQLLQQGFNILPIIPPAVENKAARLRFFFSSAHTKEQVAKTIDACQSALK
jgi:7-keto-8-aminopelargonate synthetase-like enzyme